MYISSKNIGILIIWWKQKHHTVCKCEKDLLFADKIWQDQMS